MDINAGNIDGTAIGAASASTAVVTTLNATAATTLDDAVTLGNAAADVVTISGTVAGGSPLVFEGTTADGFETTFTFTDPTADRTITFPNTTGTVALTAAVATIELDNLGTVAINTSLLSDTDNTDDLGSAAKSWKDLYIDGTATLATVDINAGNIDGTAIGAASASTAVVTTLNATGATTLDDAVTLGNAAADVVTISGTVAGGSPLVFEGTTADGFETTFTFTDPTADRTLTIPDATGTVALTSDITTIDVNGGTIDGATIGASSASTGAFTTLSTTGAVDLDDAVTINEAGADKDMRVEGDTDVDLFFVDASTERVGISTNAPSTTLDVQGTLNASGATTLDGAVTLGDAAGDAITSTGDFSATNTVNLGSSTLTLSTDAVTATKSYHIIAAESGTTDNCATISGAAAGDIIIISADAGDTITIKDGTGNIKCGADRAMVGNDGDVMHLVYDGSNWLMVTWSEN